MCWCQIKAAEGDRSINLIDPSLLPHPHLQSGGLSNAVGANKTQHLAWPRHWQPERTKLFVFSYSLPKQTVIADCQSWCPSRPDLCSLNVLGPYRCVVSLSRFLGKLMIMMASKGHFCGCPCKGLLVYHLDSTHGFACMRAMQNAP